VATAAAIFDMDGVLVDSEPTHFAVARQILAPARATVTDATFRKFVGRPVKEFLTEAIDRHSLPGTLAHYEAQYDELFLKALEQPLSPREGAVWLIDELRRRACKVGLASTSKRAWIAAALRATGLEGAFDVVVGGDMVVRPKPAPDVYLLAAERLSLAPGLCVAIEDSPSGILAARAAGMRVVGLITADVDVDALRRADVVVGSLREFPLSLINRGEDGGTVGVS
jgi:HAD superfamily hydrolase (TIGR01509 family)